MPKILPQLRDSRLTKTETLNFQVIPVWLRNVAQVLHDCNYQVYLVGGAVRDLIWGTLPHDWDLATDALPEEVEKLFPGSSPIGKKFGTITVVREGAQVEITTFRADLGYQDGRHPAAVVFGRDIVTDLGRRDFTINAMAYHMFRGELVDPFQGRRDCYRHILKTVGDPRTRFQEDGLRMLRFYRFLATQDLRPDRRAAQAVDPELAKTLSMERVRDEFSKLMLGKRVAAGLDGFARKGLIDLFIPELTPALTFATGYNRLWDHLVTATATIAPVLELRLAALLHDIAKPQTFSRDGSAIHFYGHDIQGAALCETVLQRLRYPKKLSEKACALVRWHMFGLPAGSSDAALRRFVAKVGPAHIPDLLELRRADIVATGRVDYHAWESWSALQKRLLDFLKGPEAFLPQLVVTGHDITAKLQINPGPAVGRLLNYLNELILEDPALNQKEVLLQKAADYLSADHLGTKE